MLKVLFFALVVRPVIFVVLGLNVRNKDKLPWKGPAVIAANHNSHLDGMVLMSLLPLRVLHRLRPVAAADYFLANRWLAWFTLNVIGIIPLDRTGTVSREHIFDDCKAALDENQILILFPEGTRGEPEQMGELKKGLYYLVAERPDVNVTPVVLHGLGRALPRGEALLVPFNCDVIVGEPLSPSENAEQFVQQLADTYEELFRYCLTRQLEEEIGQ